MKCTDSDIVGIKACSVPNIKSTIEQSSKNPGKTMCRNKERGNGTIPKTKKQKLTQEAINTQKVTRVLKIGKKLNTAENNQDNEAYN